MSLKYRLASRGEQGVVFVDDAGDTTKEPSAAHLADSAVSALLFGERHNVALDVFRWEPVHVRYGLRHRTTREWLTNHVASSADPRLAVTFEEQGNAETARAEVLEDFADSWVVEPVWL